jgi:NCAIR mutase (PurE)-related protein
MDHPEIGVLFDHARLERIGLPEAVFCQGKPIAVLEKLMQNHGGEVSRPLLFTRL